MLIILTKNEKNRSFLLRISLSLSTLGYLVTIYSTVSSPENLPMMYGTVAVIPIPARFTAIASGAGNIIPPRTKRTSEGKTIVRLLAAKRHHKNSMAKTVLPGEKSRSWSADISLSVISSTAAKIIIRVIITAPIIVLFRGLSKFTSPFQKIF